MRRPTTLAAAAGVLVLASCSPGTPQATQDPAAEAASTLSATVSQNGRDVHVRRIQVKVRQESGPALDLLGISAVVPGFAGDSHRDLETTTRPDGGLDLPVQLGDAQCEAPSSGGSITVTLTVAGLDDPVTVEAPDQNGALARLHGTECNARAVSELVPLAWSEEWVPEGTGESLVSTGSLRVGPVPAGHTATLVGVDGTVLFTPAFPQVQVSAESPVTVASGEAFDLPVSLSPTRCDAHAVSEGLPHRGYAFKLRIGVDGGEPAVVTVSPPEGARNVMLNALLDRCGLR